MTAAETPSEQLQQDRELVDALVPLRLMRWESEHLNIAHRMVYKNGQSLTMPLRNTLKEIWERRVRDEEKREG